MSGHLEAEAIARCVLGESSPQEQAHLALCCGCRREIDEFEEALRTLRGCIRQWSCHEYAAVCEPGVVWLSRPSIGTACSIAVILFFSILGLGLSFEQRTHKQKAAPSADADAGLLDQVGADLARRVPKGMEPLLNLVSPADYNTGEPLP